MLRLGFLASHNGGSMRAIVRAAASGALAAEPVIVISNNPAAPALAFARGEGLDARHISGRVAGGEEAADRAISAALRDAAVDLVVLSGYMRKLGAATLDAFAGRILNVHPALLPKFGGQGMYGVRVHAAVLEAGEAVSGATIHLVDGEYDNGRILARAEVPVLHGDTAEDLAARVGAIEPGLYVATLQRIVAGELLSPPDQACRTRLMPVPDDVPFTS